MILIKQEFQFPKKQLFSLEQTLFYFKIALFEVYVRQVNVVTGRRVVVNRMRSDRRSQCKWRVMARREEGGTRGDNVSGCPHAPGHVTRRRLGPTTP